MNRRWLRLVSYVIVVIPLLSFQALAQAPVIDTLNPGTGPVNTYVTINGTHFGSNRGSSTVTFNGINARGIIGWNDNAITALVPQGASTGPVMVTTQAGPSNQQPFTVTLGIGRVTPAAGPTGINVTILGSGFGQQGQGSSTVKFNGVLAPPSSNWSDTSITVQVPSNATSGPVVVNVGGVDSNGVYFTVQQPAGPVTSIAISPATATMFVGQAKNVTLKDNNGASVTTAQWNVSDNTLLRLSTDNPPVLTALAPGTVTLTATYSGLTANSTVTIVSGILPTGTVLWSVPALSASGGRLLHVDNADDGMPAIYAMDTNNYTLSAFTDDGQQLWKVTDPSNAGMAVDNNSGVLTFDGSNASIVRRDSNTGLPTWRYNSPLCLSGSKSNGFGFQGGCGDSTAVAIHPDGTIFAAEILPNDITDPNPNHYRAAQHGEIVALNPNTGWPRFLIPMPVNHVVVNIPECDILGEPAMSFDYTTPAGFGRLTVGPDGTVYSILKSTSLTEDVPGGPCFPGHDVREDTMQLLTIQPTGASNLQPIATYHYDFVPRTDGYPPDIIHGLVIPDDNGGILATWNMTAAAVGPVHDPQVNVWHRDSSGAVNTYVLGTMQRLDASIMGDGNVVYSSGVQINSTGPDISTVSAYDPSTGAVQWTSTAPAGNSFQLNMAVTDGVFAAQYGSSGTQLVKFDASGNQTPYNLGSNPTYSSPGVWNAGNANGNLQALVGPPSCLGVSFWQFNSGNRSGQNAAKPSACITANFGPGPKSPDDNLHFLPSVQACSENLGLFNCFTSQIPSWVRNLEVQAKVNDDASKWFVAQDFTGGRDKGIRTDLQPFDDLLPSHDDTPDPSAVQQPAGQKAIFWLDAPGRAHTEQGVQVDSTTRVMNFVSKVCSTQAFQLNNPCFRVNWFLKFVVNPGGQLDFINSQAGIGTASTDF